MWQWQMPLYQRQILSGCFCWTWPRFLFGFGVLFCCPGDETHVWLGDVRVVLFGGGCFLFVLWLDLPSLVLANYTTYLSPLMSLSEPCHSAFTAELEEKKSFRRWSCLLFCTFVALLQWCSGNVFAFCKIEFIGTQAAAIWLEPFVQWRWFLCWCLRWSCWCFVGCFFLFPWVVTITHGQLGLRIGPCSFDTPKREWCKMLHNSFNWHKHCVTT